MPIIAGDIAHFRLRVRGFDTDDLRVTAFDGAEGLGELFDFRVQLCTKGDTIDPDQLVGQPAALEIDGEHGTRTIHGLLRRFELIEDGATVTSYEANLVPAHWLLTRRIQSRVFNAKRCKDMTVIGIVSKVLADAGLSPDDLTVATSAGFEVREFVVQYRESDWDFIARLLEGEGVYYYFDHGSDGCKLVLTDDKDSHRVYADHAKGCVPYREANGLVAETEFIYQARVCSEMRIGKVALDDFDFKRPAHELRTDAVAERFKTLAQIDYPGGFVDAKRGRRLTDTRLQEQQCGTRVLSLAATVRGFWAGGRVTMIEHPVDAFNGTYLITRVMHRAAQTQSAETDGFDGVGCRYEAELRVIPAATQFRPPCVTPIPTVLGSQTAIVVGPPGEEIHTDEFGRVEVRFHWDQEGKHDVGASCWMRVSHGWAGGQYGMIFLPRVGQEVIVDFLEGNPDQPIITGRVYNGDHLPPYKLPENKTISAIRTCSSPGAKGGNEVRFEDAKGKEQLLLFAQRTMHLRARCNRYENTGGELHRTVHENEYELCKKNKHSSVSLDQFEDIRGNLHLHVDKDVKERVMGQSTSYVHNKYSLMGAGGVVIASDTSITLVCNGNFIKIDDSGVTIVGTMVNINSGGSPDQYQSNTPDLGEFPKNADTTESGRNVTYAAQTAQLDGLDVATAGTQPPAEEIEAEKLTSWIEIELVDEIGQPVPNEEYAIIAPDGKTIRKGRLNAKGLAHESIPDPGMCEICFPNLDAAAWEPAAGAAGRSPEGGAPPAAAAGASGAPTAGESAAAPTLANTPSQTRAANSPSATPGQREDDGAQFPREV